MKYQKIITTFLLTSFISLFAIPANAAISYSENFANQSPAINIQWGCPSNSWYSVTSKWQQPRNTGTNPHNGVDIGSPYGGEVRAIYSGWTKNEGNYTIVLNIDSNGDGINNDGYQCRYYHLSGRKPEGKYNKGDIIGYSGNEGGKYPSHLHFGGYVNGKWCRNQPQYRWTTNWNSGKAIDSFSNVEWLGNKCSITAYFKDENGEYTPSSMRLFYRKAGTSTWTDGGEMTKGSNYVYSYNFSGKFPSGTNIQWLVRIQRPNITSAYAWAPAKFQNPAANPNATSYAYAYYSNTLS